MRLFLVSAIAAIAIPGLPLAAQASLVKEAPLASVCRGDVPLVVHSGMGATIDFTQTGKIVQRAWLGDPSKVTLDADRPIEEGSSVLFLRRINGLNFNGLPSTASTVLTTVLISADGSEVCQIPVSYSSTLPNYTSLKLIPSDEPDSRAIASGDDDLVTRLLRTSSVNLDDVEAGINANALSLGEGNLVVIRVKEFIARTRGGAEQKSTAQELGIEWSLVLELSRQGKERASFAETVSL